ncbi:MAG: taurine dioxygenase [Planctomycetota bacterium]|jgi:taurine dioxygenase
MSVQKLRIKPRSVHIGAFIEGVDLSQPLDDSVIAEIRQALLDYYVIFFRDQSITPEQHLAIAARFGEIEKPHPIFGGDETDARVSVIESKGRPGDSEHYWHTDVTYQQAPVMGSILVARKIPDIGGDTLFANMYATYEALSEPMQRFLCGLTASHSFERGWRKTLMLKEGGDARLLEFNRHFPLMSHPVVRSHPETGRKSLFVNEYYTSHIDGLTEVESNGLLQLLIKHSQIPEFQVRHVWKTNDIAFWDNRCTQHYASQDYGAAHRLMHRVTIVGDRPYL